MPDSPFHTSQLGFTLDTSGRPIYGYPGQAGTSIHAELRYIPCPGCGREFGTYYPQQRYHDDTCAQRFRRAKKRLARRVYLDPALAPHNQGTGSSPPAEAEDENRPAANANTPPPANQPESPDLGATLSALYPNIGE